MDEQSAHVDAGRHAGGENFLVERFLGGEQERFEDAQLLGAFLFPVSITDDHTHLRDIRHRTASPSSIPRLDASSRPPLASGRLRM